MLKRFFAILTSLCTIAGLVFGIYRSVCPPVQPMAAESPSPSVQDDLYRMDDESAGENGYAEAAAVTPALPAPAVPDESPASEEAPLLNEAQLLEQAAKLSDAPLWAQWLLQSTPCRRILRTMDDIVQGQRPVEALDFLAPSQAFSAQLQSDGSYIVSTNAIARFQPAIDIIAAFSPQQLAQLYLKAEPLLQEEYRKLGSRDNVRDLLRDFCATVLAIPEFDCEPELIRVTDTLYRYKNPEFERLTDGQKLLVRTGYRNCAKLRELCRALADELDLIP